MALRAISVAVLTFALAWPGGGAEAKPPKRPSAAACKAKRTSKACKRYCARHRRAKVCRRRAARRRPVAPSPAPPPPQPATPPAPDPPVMVGGDRDPDRFCPPVTGSTGLLPPASGSGPDPLRSRQWGLEQIRAPEAWMRTTGAGILVAVVDSGVDHRHPDLRAATIAGRDWAAGDRCALDENGHGTHVAGIIAARRDNGSGVAGVAPEAEILPLRIADENGMGEFSHMNEAIRHAVDAGAKVVNISFGAGIVTGQTGDWSGTEAVVDYAFSRGTLVVTAAGNTSTPLCSYPAAAAKVVCVAATDPEGRPAHYSNLPVNPDGLLALRAPGGAGLADADGTPGNCEPAGGVMSAYWAGAPDDCGAKGYQALSGSSQAAPHVAGVAALLAAQGLGPQQIVDRLKATSSNRGSYDPVMGYGIVDAAAAVAGG